MTKLVRFSLDLTVPATVPDSSPQVLHGTLEGVVISSNGASYALGSVQLLPPCSPTKIVCVGRNYADHAKELGNAVPVEPLIFMKPPSSIAAHGDDIIYPSLSNSISYEGELGVIIGKRARNIDPADWEEYVLGSPGDRREKWGIPDLRKSWNFFP